MEWRAQVWVKWNKNFSQKKCWESVKVWKEVTAAWSTMGDWDMLLEVKAKTPDDVEAFIWKKLRETNWVEQTHTSWAKEMWQKSA